jgi:hypothetical protein
MRRREEVATRSTGISSDGERLQVFVKGCKRHTHMQIAVRRQLKQYETVHDII